MRVCVASVLLLPCLALAQPQPQPDEMVEPDLPLSPWSQSSGELGFAAARGNSSTESFNGRLKLHYNSGEWHHHMDVFGLRSSARYTSRAAGGMTRERQVTANRYSIAIGSAWQLGEYRQLTASLRHEHDTFAAFDSRYIFGLSYGTRLIDGERLLLETQFGPGGRRSRNSRSRETENDLIARGVFDLKVGLTDNTELVNTLMVESGSSNTFAQNDFGVSVAMNRQLALKAGWQTRYNSDVDPGRSTTDTLATMNVVYRFK